MSAERISAEEFKRRRAEAWRQALVPLSRLASPIAQEAYKGKVIEGVVNKEPTNGAQAHGK